MSGLAVGAIAFALWAAFCAFILRFFYCAGACERGAVDRAPLTPAAPVHPVAHEVCNAP